jgi:signal transduction histidine kinase/DNA-binding response OmpR family regulator
LFIWRFLKVYTWNRWLNWFLVTYILGTVALFFAAPVLGHHVMSKIWMASLLLVPLLVISTAVAAIFKRVRQGWYVLLGWTPMVTMTLIAVLAMAGFVENPPSGARINTAVFFELLFLSLALADRVRQLRDERALAVKANEEKSSFLAMLSHEVRTPLNGILGTVELLRHTVLTAKQKDYVETLNHAGRALLTLLNDVLDLAKAEAGKIELTPGPVNPRLLLQSMTDLMAGRAREKGVVLECAVADDVPETVLADEVRLRQILLNLISNAVKFTDHGRVDVTLRRDIDTASGRRGRHRLLWEVRDTGIGIPRQAIGTLFDRFVQIDSSSTRRHEGTGLGLAICRELVEIMGGSIGAESREGEGSRFYFALDLEAVDRPVAIVEEIPYRALELTAGYEPATVLIVDDVEMNRDVLGELMRNEGFIVEVAGDGASALQRVAEKAFDAIVLDIFMPDMDGMTVAQKLRRDHESLVIIGLTAATDPALFAACRQSGMDEVLSKPASPRELSTRIRQLTGTGRDVSQLPVLDDAILRRFRDSLGETKMAAIVSQFRDSSQAQLETIGKSLQTRDLSSLTVESHRLSGTASTLGLVRLGAVAEDISVKARQGEAGLDNFDAEAVLTTLHADSLQALTKAMSPEPEPVPAQ